MAFCNTKKKKRKEKTHRKGAKLARVQPVNDEIEVETSIGTLGLSSVQLLSCVQLFVTPWTAADQASLSFQLPKLAQTHVHPFKDAIQPSYPLSSPSPPAPNPSQHQGLFRGVPSSHQVAKASEFQLQHQFFQ